MGVIRKDGTWSVEPQTGTIKSVYPTEGGLLVTVSQDDESYETIDQDGWTFTDLENLTLSGYNGYSRGAYEVYNGKLYTTVNGKLWEFRAMVMWNFYLSPEGNEWRSDTDVQSV